MLKEVNRGTGSTCIFFHKSYLSQYVLEGKHPSSRWIMYNQYLNLSHEIFKPEAGDVVCLSENQKVSKCSEDKSRFVLGIVSTDSRMAMGKEYKGDDAIQLALAGRVPVKVKGKISRGDLLVSSENGFARACKYDENCQGSVVGKAMEGSNAELGKITALVTLQ